MILEEATFKAYGYCPSNLTPKSHKLILVACELCGEFRIIPKDGYRVFCNSCSSILSGKNKGKKHWNFGKRGEETPNYKGRLKIKDQKEYMRLYHKKYVKSINGKNAISKNNIKHRGLGYTLLTPLAEGDVGHHVTDEYVIGIPADVHNSIGGKRKKHRMLILQWLKNNDKKKYLKVLCILAKEL